MKYEYQCQKCNQIFEINTKIGKAPRNPKCPKCGHKGDRVFSLSGIVFHGGGFYASEKRKEQLKKQHTEFTKPEK